METMMFLVLPLKSLHWGGRYISRSTHQALKQHVPHIIYLVSTSSKSRIIALPKNFSALEREGMEKTISINGGSTLQPNGRISQSADVFFFLYVEK